MTAGTRTVYAELQRKEFENLHINGLQKAYPCIDSLGRRAQISRFSGSVGIPLQTKRMIDQRELVCHRVRHRVPQRYEPDMAVEWR
jgi:hypothetical protein